jgi:hypothetical protein
MKKRDQIIWGIIAGAFAAIISYVISNILLPMFGIHGF